MFNIWRLILTCVHKCHNRSISEYFVSEVLRDIFFFISKKMYILYERGGWGILPFEKRTVHEGCEKSPQMHTVPSGLQQQLLCCPSLAPGKRPGEGMLLTWVFCVTVCGSAMPLGEEYLAVQDPWDREQRGQGKRKMQWLCTSNGNIWVVVFQWDVYPSLILRFYIISAYSNRYFASKLLGGIDAWSSLLALNFCHIQQ